jgi:outer membrane protein
MRQFKPGIAVAICLVSLVCLVSLGGCAAWDIDIAPDRADKPWAPATTTTGEIVPGAKPSKDSKASYALPINTDLTGLPAPLGLDRHRAYSLPELIDIAQSNNPLTRTAWNDARNAALATGIAESAYLPRVRATAAEVYLNNQGSVSAAGSSFPSNAEANGPIAAASLEWLLFDFGERAAKAQAAKQASIISNIAFNATHQQIIYDVSVAFYANAAARAHAATAGQSLKDAQEVEAAATDRYKNAIGTVVEVSQAHQATAQAKLALVQATGAAENAYLNLISAMGISPLTRINVVTAANRRLSPGMTASIQGIISTALARRPDILTAYAAQKAANADVDAAVAEFLPKVFLTGTTAYNAASLSVTSIPGLGQQSGTANINPSRFASSVLVGATVPIYDGGTRAALLEQARNNADSAGALLTRRRNDAVRQLVVADNALRTSLSAYSASNALAAAAQTTFDGALASYRNRVGSITDVNIAQSQLLQARNASTDAYSMALSAAATLALATGALGSAPR